jgi:hypothetical protein
MGHQRLALLKTARDLMGKNLSLHWATTCKILLKSKWVSILPSNGHNHFLYLSATPFSPVQKDDVKKKKNSMEKETFQRHYDCLGHLKTPCIWHLQKTKVDNAKQYMITSCFVRLITDLCFRVVCCSGNENIPLATRICKNQGWATWIFHFNIKTERKTSYSFVLGHFG